MPIRAIDFNRKLIAQHTEALRLASQAFIMFTESQKDQRAIQQEQASQQANNDRQIAANSKQIDVLIGAIKEQSALIPANSIILGAV